MEKDHYTLHKNVHKTIISNYQELVFVRVFTQKFAFEGSEYFATPLSSLFKIIIHDANAILIYQCIN